MSSLMPIVLLALIGVLWLWRSRSGGPVRKGKQQAQKRHADNSENGVLIERARDIRSRREVRSAQRTELQPVFDATASARRIQRAVQGGKSTTVIDEPVPQFGLSTEVFVIHGPTSPAVQQYTLWYLLSRFEGGSNIHAFSDHPVYAHRLETSAENVLRQFIEDGWIRKLNASEALDHNLKSTELKAILKTHGRPVTGRKSELVQRVLDLDDDKVRQAAESSHFVMTEEGRRVIAPFYEQEKRRHTAAQSAIEHALRDGDIGQALKVSQEYDQLLMWGAARVQNDATGRQALAGILSSTLGNATDRELAAMMALIPKSPPGVPERLLN